MSAWFEDDEFWSTWFPYVFSEKRFDQAVTEVDHLLALTNFERGRVLDLACGPGRHAIELAKRGWPVISKGLRRARLTTARSLLPAERS